MTDLPLDYEQLRSLVLRSLTSANQLESLYRAVASHAAQMLNQPESEAATNTIGPQFMSTGRSLGGDNLTGRDKGRVQDIVWDFMIEGLVRPGLNDGLNSNLPFYHVTDRGQEATKHGQLTPYDPDGYLRRLREDVPNLDDVILTYINESLHTFRIGCLLSSTISLGCASEKALLLLIEAYASRLPSLRQEKFRKEVEGRTVKRQFDEFQKHIESAIKPKLPGDLKDDLDVHLLGVFSMIRRMRNDAGHPTGKVVERQEAYANLTVFPMYLRHVYRLIDLLMTATF